MTLIELQKKRRIRLISMLLALAVCGLMIGASRLGDSILSYRQTVENTHLEWKEAVHCLLSGVQTASVQDQQKLQEIAVTHPEILLQAFYSEIKPEGTTH